MGTSGDKIVLLDGMGSGSGSAANGLLSMIPGMFTSLLGGNKMDPNLVAALMNGRNNQDQFGGANGWFGEREIRDEYDGTEPYMRRGRRSRYY
jgi:hypothetical protein